LLSVCTDAILYPATTNLFLFEGKICLVSAPKRILGKVYVQVRSFLNSALCGVEWLLLEASGAFRQRHGPTHEFCSVERFKKFS